MDRRRILTGSAAITAVGLSMWAGRLHAQQEKGKGKGAPPPPAEPPKPWKDAIVGSWQLLIIDGVKADGTHVPIYGPNPKGLAIFTADGRYSQQIMRDVRPKFESNNRIAGTAEENKAAVEGAISHFSKYTVNESDRTLSLQIEGSSFPNWDNTPRSGTTGMVLHGSTPELFRMHLRKALQRTLLAPSERRLVFVKSWNEWAEGNHLEPDLRYGRGYLEVIREELEQANASA